jgi:signal transduction histidine kinase
LLSFLNDRLELARRLHDGPAQQLVALGLAIDELVSDPQISPSTRSALRTLRLSVIDTSKSLRSEIYSLRSLTVADLKVELEKRLQGIAVELSWPEIQLDSKIEDALIRSLLEIVRNCQKHSRAKTFKIEVISNKFGIEVIASDDGTGQIPNQNRSLGLKSITEPINEIGGKVILETSNVGSTYRMEIPYP